MSRIKALASLAMTGTLQDTEELNECRAIWGLGGHLSFPPLLSLATLMILRHTCLVKSLQGITDCTGHTRQLPWHCLL